MAYNFAGGGGDDQVFLMPPDPRDWLPEGHLAWAVRRSAGELDLAPFLSAYRADGQGKRAYHPRMMVALIVYCYCKGIRSSRAVEMATFDDVGARVICGGLHPDHATCARFVTRHREPLRGLLVQSLAACAREGLVRVDVMAGDGTKVKANASMAANATAEQPGLGIAELEELLQAEVAAWIEEACAADAAGDALFSGDGGPGGPPGGGTPSGAARTRTAGKLARRKAAAAKPEAERAAKIARLAAEKDRLEARAAEELAKAGPRSPGTPGALRRRPPGGAGGRPAGLPGRPGSSVTSARPGRRPPGPRASWPRRSPPPPSRPCRTAPPRRTPPT
jgi:transposase